MTFTTFKISNNYKALTFLGFAKIGAFTDDLFLKPGNYWDLIEATPDEDQLHELLQAWEEGNAAAIDEIERLTGLKPTPLEYFTETSRSTGLTVAEALTGIGRIDMDGGYNTIYSTTLDKCDAEELEAILRATRLTESERDEVETLLNGLNA